MASSVQRTNSLTLNCTSIEDSTKRFSRSQMLSSTFAGLRVPRGTFIKKSPIRRHKQVLTVNVTSPDLSKQRRQSRHNILCHSNSINSYLCVPETTYGGQSSQVSPIRPQLYTTRLYFQKQAELSNANYDIFSLGKRHLLVAPCRPWILINHL